MAFMTPPSSSGSGDFTPVLAFKANQGRLYVRDRLQDPAGNWNTTETEVTKAEPAFAVDFGTLMVGWCHFTAGQAPQWAMVPYGQPLPPRPASPGNDDAGKALNYRNGFRIKVAGTAIGGVRELAGNSAALINGMNELHSQFEAAPEAAAGKIPVVKMTDTIAVKAGQSTNFQPVFTIQAWVDRPDILGERTVPAPSPRAAPAVAAPVTIATMNAGQVAAMANATVSTNADAMPF